MEEAIQEARDKTGELPESIRLHHADASTFPFPDLDLIASDPPWASMESYETLARIARDHLRPGGLLLAQCGVQGIARVLDLTHGLEYVHTLAIVYDQASGGTMLTPWQSNWRPVLVLSKGKKDRSGLQFVSDTFTVGRAGKTHHEWQQPEQPWAYWLSRLAIPGQLVADPFSGSGTTALVCRGLGLRFIGTEKKRATYEVARGRLLA